MYCFVVTAEEHGRTWHLRSRLQLDCNYFAVLCHGSN